MPHASSLHPRASIGVDAARAIIREILSHPLYSATDDIEQKRPKGSTT